MLWFGGKCGDQANVIGIGKGQILPRGQFEVIEIKSRSHRTATQSEARCHPCGKPVSSRRKHLWQAFLGIRFSKPLGSQPALQIEEDQFQWFARVMMPDFIRTQTVEAGGIVSGY